MKLFCIGGVHHGKLVDGFLGEYRPISDDNPIDVRNSGLPYYKQDEALLTSERYVFSNINIYDRTYNFYYHETVLNTKESQELMFDVFRKQKGREEQKHFFLNNILDRNLLVANE